MYETQEDRDNELRIAQSLLNHLCDEHLKLMKLPHSYNLDFAAVNADGRVMYYIEAKKRNIASTVYSSTMLNVEKTQCTLVQSGEVCYLVVEWTDKIGYTTFENFEHLPHYMIGRKDRGNENDICPHIKIPIDYFEFYDYSATQI